jgi:tRNA threonylcarbamoyladenosine biosynthesis protein TsaE
MQFKFACPKLEDTQDLAAKIGSVLKGGEVFELKSDLGGGKTTFTKGLARGMGVTDVVQSPTFIISSLHNGHKGLELHHFDFYRLNDAGIMSAELAESLHQNNAVVAVEWGDIVHDVLPKDRATVSLSVPEGETRVITIDLPESYQELIEALKNYQQGNIA